MSAKLLSFTGKLTLQDTLDLHHYRSLLVVRRSVRWLVTAVSLLIITAVVLAGIQSHFTWPLYFIIALFGYFPLSFLLDRLRVARYYRRHPDKYVESTVDLGEDIISVENVNYQTRLRWNQLSRVVSTRRGLLFVLPPYQPLCWLPQRLFEGNSKKEQILNLAQHHDVRIKRLA
jgi:hypothetical protein